jgi:Cu-processing system permease protein
MTGVTRIARFVARDLSRSRWLLSYAAFFAVAAWALLRFSDAGQKALLALVSVVLFVVPLASVVFGSMYLYGAREFVELLLAQPVPRRTLFGGLYLGLAVPLSLAVTAGVAVPVVLQGGSGDSLGITALIVAMAIALSMAFAGLAAIIAYSIQDRARGLAAALGAWLILAVAYDGIALLLATQFADYPLERPMLAAMIANPVDLARLLLLLHFDAAALLGYTGAVYQRFFSGVAGIAIAAGALLLWTTVPALAGGRLFLRKDF